MEKKDKDISCPVCGQGTFLEKDWKDGGYHNLRIRATWVAHGYPKKENAWFYKDAVDARVYPIHAVVDSASFGRCGYQDCDIGLTVCINLERGGSTCWTFFNYGDIAEFFQRSKAHEVKDLVGTPVMAFMSGEFNGSIRGIDVIDNLVL